MNTEYINFLKSIIKFFRGKRVNWTKGNLATDDLGTPCEVSSERATCFCIMGGIQKVGFRTRNMPKMIDKLSLDLPNNEGSKIAFWNDDVCKSKNDLINTLQTIIKNEEEKD